MPLCCGNVAVDFIFGCIFPPHSIGFQTIRFLQLFLELKILLFRGEMPMMYTIGSTIC